MLSDSGLITRSKNPSRLIEDMVISSRPDLISDSLPSISCQTTKGMSEWLDRHYLLRGPGDHTKGILAGLSKGGVKSSSSAAQQFRAGNGHIPVNQRLKRVSL